MHALKPQRIQSEEPILSRDVLNIENKVRSNLFPWRGQFSPQLVEAHLGAYASEGSLVLDPFVGSGTVLHECARRAYRALGAEVNPAAAIMARTYEFVAQTPAKRNRITPYNRRAARTTRR